MTTERREYNTEQLALFAEYRSVRLPFRPAGCVANRAGPKGARWREICWVEAGPPGMTRGGGGACIGCGQQPRTRPLLLVT